MLIAARDLYPEVLLIPQLQNQDGLLFPDSDIQATLVDQDPQEVRIAVQIDVLVGGFSSEQCCARLDRWIIRLVR